VRFDSGNVALHRLQIFAALGAFRDEGEVQFTAAGTPFVVYLVAAVHASENHRIVFGCHPVHQITSSATALTA
jgi:hypothetical protein